VSSIVLFLIGASLAVFTFPKALQFLISVGGPNLVPMFSPSKYLRLILLMIGAFGLSFELPVLLVFLQLAHVLSPARLSKWRRPAAVVIFIFAAVITPSQDPISLFAMALPMCLFYEASIVIGRMVRPDLKTGRGRRKLDARDRDRDSGQPSLKP
jgi:sec-independent protein translocase protein TatC